MRKKKKKPPAFVVASASSKKKYEMSFSFNFFYKREKKTPENQAKTLLRLVPQQLAPLAVLVLVHLVLALPADRVGAEGDEIWTPTLLLLLLLWRGRSRRRGSRQRPRRPRRQERQPPGKNCCRRIRLHQRCFRPLQYPRVKCQRICLLRRRGFRPQRCCFFLGRRESVISECRRGRGREKFLIGFFFFSLLVPPKTKLFCETNLFQFPPESPHEPEEDACRTEEAEEVDPDKPRSSKEAMPLLPPSLPKIRSTPPLPIPLVLHAAPLAVRDAEETTAAVASRAHAAARRSIFRNAKAERERKRRVSLSFRLSFSTCETRSEL